jgi:serpin B
MAYNGAAGETEEVMAETLELKDLSLQQINKAHAELIEILMSLDSSVQFKMANSIWADLRVRLRTSFADNIKEFFSAGIRNLDLSDPRSLVLINRWAKEITEGKIVEIVDKDDLDAILFIINAVHFKGSWTIGFKEEDTHEGDFTLQDGSLKKVPMMVSQSESYPYYQGEGFQAVSLPYGNEKVSLDLFLPDRESSLKEFRMKLNRGNWESWMSKFKKELVMVNLPRLKLENEITLNEVLKTLGMEVAFTSRADFTKMCFGSAFIDYVKHMSFAEINEEGTEASAATIVKMKRGGKHVLRFDRPFFLAIRDNVTGSILFMSSVVEP